MKTKIRLKKDWYAISSNNIPLNVDEFKEKAKLYKAGTIFVNYGKGTYDPNEDEDCIENDSLHGWCYVADVDKNGSEFINYCNMLDYVLDYWPQYPDMFEAVEPNKGETH